MQDLCVVLRNWRGTVLLIIRRQSNQSGDSGVLSSKGQCRTESDASGVFIAVSTSCHPVSNPGGSFQQSPGTDNPLSWAELPVCFPGAEETQHRNSFLCKLRLK